MDCGNAGDVISFLLSPFRHRFLLWLFSSDVSSLTAGPSVYLNIYVEIPGKGSI